MTKQTIAFIGAGNMASSIISGLIANDYDPKKIWASNPSQEKLTALNTRLGVNITTDNLQAASHADCVILAVKPNVLKTVANELADVIKQKQPLVLSIVSGIRIESLHNYLGEKTPIIRCMPNTPALIGTGASGLYASDKVNEDQKGFAESIMRAVGITLWLENEAQIDIVTVLSGSGPAYFFLVMEALVAAATELGLEEKTANLLTLQTALGAAKLAMESEHDPATLRKQVTSPGGTTEQALATLEAGDIRKLFLDALTNAKKRAEELSQLV